MKAFSHVCLCVLCFPVDLLRLTLHAGSYTHARLVNRWISKHEEQLCLFCRDLNVGETPRRLRRQIRYRNLWMIRLLHRELELGPPDKGGRKIPFCRKEGGYVQTPWYTPWLWMGLCLFWVTLAIALLCAAGIIPLEVQARAVANIR